MRKLWIYILSLLLICGCSTNTNEEEKNNTNKQEEQTNQVEYQAYTSFFESIYTKDDIDVPLLNTMVKLVVYEESKQQEAYDLVFPLLTKYHQYSDSTYEYVDEDGNLINNLKIINDSYGSEEKMYLEEEFYTMLKEAISLSQLTKGYFNPFIGHVVDVYGNKFTSFPIENTDPEEADIKKAVGCSVAYNELDSILEMNDSDYSVIFHQVDHCSITPKLSLGAFSKGYILDRATELLNTLHISYMLDLGTSSIATHTVENSKDTWNVGIRNPFNKVTALYAIQVKGNTSISTSGDDSRYYLLKVDEETTKIRHHILNPFTGYSENYYRNVTLTSQEGTGAILDVLSTAIFNLATTKEVEDMIQAFEAAYSIEIDYALTTPVNDTKVDVYCNEAMNQQILESNRANALQSIHIN